MNAGKAEITLVLGAILVLVLLCEAAVAIPVPPHKFYGNVTIDGKPAPDGTVVSAKIEDVEYANTTASNGKYDFNIPSDDEDTIPKEGGINGEEVKFYVNDELAANATFSFGSITKLSLKIGEEPVLEPEPEPEKPVPVPSQERILTPVTLVIIVALLAFAAAVIVFVIWRRKK